MEKFYSTLPSIPVNLRMNKTKAGFENWRHSIGHGGINKYPLPPAVTKGLAALKPRLVRTFIQEYFNIYPTHDTFNWTDLDPYMESLAASGGKVVAAITIKPKPLFSEVNQDVIIPNDVAEWQRVVEALVNRYSVEKPIVTHWEVGNEMDMGEPGGCPYRTQEPDVYNAYYRITVEAVLRAFPGAKVGGPVLAVPQHPMMEGLIKYCAETGVPLDFVSWHGYSDDPQYFVRCMTHVKALLDKYFPGKKIETMVTEFSKWFHDGKVEDAEMDGLRSATVAASVMDMADAGVDWTFYYHIWDQVLVSGQFAPFFSPGGVDDMMTYWNKTPCNFGLFDVCGKARPIYYMYKLLAEMTGAECEAESDAADIRVKGVVDDSGTARVMLVNYDQHHSRDVLAALDFNGVGDGFKLLTIHRVDGNSRVDGELLVPVERRYTQVAAEYSEREFFCQVYLPANSVALVTLERVMEEDMLASYG